MASTTEQLVLRGEQQGPWEALLLPRGSGLEAAKAAYRRARARCRRRRLLARPAAAAAA